MEQGAANFFPSPRSTLVGGSTIFASQQSNAQSNIGRSYSVPTTSQQAGGRFQNQNFFRRPASPNESILSASDYQVSELNSMNLAISLT